MAGGVGASQEKINMGGLTMSKSALSGFILVVLAAFIPASVTADTGDDIERMEEQRGQAILNADMPTLYAIYADDFFYNRAGGDSLTRAQYLPMYASGELKVNKMAGEGRDIHVYGDTAVDAKSFDGLHKLVPAGQMVHVGNAVLAQCGTITDARQHQ
jgi:hypothetical protein